MNIDIPFRDRPRVDARDKVLGRTQYGADVPVADLLFAMMVPSRIAKGRVVLVDKAAAMDVPGVIRVFAAPDFPAPSEPPPGPPLPAMITDIIAYRGQPIALVVAQTLEAAIEGAEAVRCEYAEDDFSSLVSNEGMVREPGKEIRAGDPETAMANAVTVFEGEYVSPNQHHNPIEMLSTTAIFENGQVVVHEGTQGSNWTRNAIAFNLGLDPAQVVVKSPTVGGGFGQRSPPQRQSAIVAYAALQLGRPIKLVLPRGQIFQNAVYRPHSRHRIKLGADANARMTAVHYDVEQQQTRRGGLPLEYHEMAARLYGIPNYLGTGAQLRIDTQATGYMRAPFEHPASFAFECAMDELALKIGLDPVEFRLRNDADVDPLSGLPLSSRFMNECIRDGASRFGWDRRDPLPASTTLPDGTQVGWGMACGAYKVAAHPSIARLRIGANGTTRFATAGHEMGQGIKSTIEQVLVRELAIDPERLEIVIGDTGAAPQHVTAGSWGTSSAVSAASAAARRMNEAIAELLSNRRIDGNLHRQLAALRRPSLEIEVSSVAPGQGETELASLRRGGMATTGPEYPSFTAFSYIAHFVEVHVEPRTRRVRVRRVVSVADCGRVISPRTARSQMLGGVVWGIGAVLREATETDPRYGGWLNNDLADYVVPVNADIGDIDVSFIDKPDPLVNALGAKGLGEVAMTGVAAAVANAIFHATGRRLREMPIRVEHLL